MGRPEMRDGMQLQTKYQAKSHPNRDYRLQTVDQRLQITDSGLEITDYRQWTKDYSHIVPIMRSERGWGFKSIIKIYRLNLTMTISNIPIYTNEQCVY